MPNAVRGTRTRSHVGLRRLFICSMMAAVTSCGDKASKAPAPAVVSHGVSESKLTTITLTTDAVLRLGIEVAPVESATVSPTRTIGGEVVVPPGESVVISSPVAGTIFAPEGSPIPAAGRRVSADQPLMRLVALPPDRDLVRVEQDFTVAQARLEQAQAEADRVAKLYADKLVSARDNERAQADLVAAQAAQQSAAGQRRLVAGTRQAGGPDVTALVITAPGSGVVRQLYVASGQVVGAGTPLAEILGGDRLWIRVPVYAGDARTFQRSTNVRVQHLGGTGVTGLVASPVAAPPSADVGSASVDLFYEVRGAAAQLRPGERVLVTLQVAGVGTRGLVVPLAAVLRDMNGGSWVYERTDSVTFVRRRVEVTRVSGDRAVLGAGPRPGTLVVTAGAVELFGTEFGAGK